VVFAVWSMPMTGGIDQAQQWTLREQFTGGDVQPVLLPSGAVLYTKYAFDQQLGKILGQVYLTTSAGTVGEALTPREDDCTQPALSPDGQQLAMTCTGGKQFANIEIAPFDGTKLGSRQVLVASQLTAQPTWAPDSKSVVYFAPQGVSGHFQLWQQQVRAEPGSPTATQTPPPTSPATPSQGGTGGTSTPTPGAVLPPSVRLTSDLDFDATSTIAWRG
jgi:Tol biopolymer transport system component